MKVSWITGQSSKENLCDLMNLKSHQYFKKQELFLKSLLIPGGNSVSFARLAR